MFNFYQYNQKNGEVIVEVASHAVLSIPEQAKVINEVFKKVCIGLLCPLFRDSENSSQEASCSGLKYHPLGNGERGSHGNAGITVQEGVDKTAKEIVIAEAKCVPQIN
ncbi:MAG: hypothetical protein AAB569_04715 [Patescibacteria group bacterium]